MKRIIIFDMDGVLFDSTDVSEKYIISQYSGMTKEMTKELLCGNFHEEIEKITIPKKKETEEEIKQRKLLFSKNKLEVPMYKGAKELLEKLHKAGHILVLNTSAHNRNSLPLLECAGITSLFDFLATAEISKSKAEKFKIISEKYNTIASDLLFVTDTLGDIREADIAGVPTIAVTWGAHNESYFNRELHENLLGIVKSFAELEALIKSY